MTEEIDKQTKTLRDEFALAALPIIVKVCTTQPARKFTYTDAAVEAYRYANAMIEARDTTRDTE